MLLLLPCGWTVSHGSFMVNGMRESVRASDKGCSVMLMMMIMGIGRSGGYHLGMMDLLLLLLLLLIEHVKVQLLILIGATTSSCRCHSSSSNMLSLWTMIETKMIIPHQELLRL